MPRLPTAADLGGLPSPASSRAVASYDVSGLARGGAALAAGAERLGRGVSQVGGDLGDLAQKFQEDAYINATANRNARFAELHTSLQNDKDYATLEDRYRKGSQKIIDEEAANVPAGRLRRHYEATSAELQATGAGAINRQAFTGLASNDAESRQALLTRIQRDIGENPDNPARQADIEGYNLRVDNAVRQGWETKDKADLEKLKAHGAIEHTSAGVLATREPLRFLRETGGLPRGDEALPAYWDRQAARRASGVSQDLMAVVKRASEISGIPFTIGDKGGTRDQATQDQLVAAGRSQTRNSNHLTGNAIDLIPVVNGKANPDAAPEHFAEINRAMTQAKQELGLDVKWGGEWKGFKDVAHYELPKGAGTGGTPRFGSLDPVTLARLQSHAQTVLHARDVDLQRMARLSEAEHKQALTNVEDEYLKDAYSADPTKTAFDAASDPRLEGSPETKKRIIGVIDRANKPDPIARVSEATSMEFVDRMRKPEGDPLKLTDRNEITDAFVAGRLSTKGYEWTLKQFDDARGGGDSYAKARSDFVKRVIEPQIMKSDISTGLNNTRVGQRAYEFEQAMDRKKAAMLKEGKNPLDMFDPTKPDYMGKEEVIKPLRRTAQKDMADMLAEEAESAGLPGKPAPLPAEPKAATSLAQLQAMVRANPALRETAIQIATERGWVTGGRPKAVGVAPQVPNAAAADTRMAAQAEAERRAHEHDWLIDRQERVARGRGGHEAPLSQAPWLDPDIPPGTGGR